MSRKLNQIRDDSAEQEIARIPGSLEKRAAKPFAQLPPDAQHRHAEIVARMYLDLARSKYQLEYPLREIVAELELAARWTGMASEVLVRAELTKRSVWSLFLHGVGLVQAFGSEADALKLAAFPSRLVGGTPEPNSPGCEVARLWKDSLATGVVPRAEIAVELKRCEAENADRWDLQWTHGIARSLIAVEDRNQRELQGGLEEVAAFTRIEAQRGGWKRLGEGQMSLVGLGLCRLAQERGVEPTVKSIYIPLELLEVTREHST